MFDLLAHVYRVPAEGGDAQCLTEDTGAALNFHPRISPDGKSIAFVSDRKGQNNLWVMDADGFERASRSKTTARRARSSRRGRPTASSSSFDARTSDRTRVQAVRVYGCSTAMGATASS